MRALSMLFRLIWVLLNSEAIFESGTGEKYGSFKTLTNSPLATNQCQPPIKVVIVLKIAQYVYEELRLFYKSDTEEGILYINVIILDHSDLDLLKYSYQLSKANSLNSIQSLNTETSLLMRSISLVLCNQRHISKSIILTPTKKDGIPYHIMNRYGNPHHK